jgi:hypothetical protein
VESRTKRPWRNSTLSGMRPSILWAMATLYGMRYRSKTDNGKVDNKTDGLSVGSVTKKAPDNVTGKDVAAA